MTDLDKLKSKHMNSANYNSKTNENGEQTHYIYELIWLDRRTDEQIGAHDLLGMNDNDIRALLFLPADEDPALFMHEVRSHLVAPLTQKLGLDDHSAKCDYFIQATEIDLA